MSTAMADSELTISEGIQAGPSQPLTGIFRRYPWYLAVFNVKVIVVFYSFGLTPTPHSLIPCENTRKANTTTLGPGSGLSSESEPLADRFAQPS